MQFLGTEGITLEISAPYAHEQNGVAERANRIIMDILRSLIIQSKLPDKLWPILLDLAMLHVNMSPKPQFGSQNHAPTPFQELYNRPSQLYSKVRPCGALVWVTFGKRPQNKLAPKAQPMAYIGHEGSKKYLLWDGRSIHKSRDVSFTDQNWIEYMNDRINQEPGPAAAINAVIETIDRNPPNSYQEAMASPDAHLWRESMKEEVDAHSEKRTWVIVPRDKAKGHHILWEMGI